MITRIGLHLPARPTAVPMAAAAAAFILLCATTTATSGAVRTVVLDVGLALLSAAATLACIGAARRATGRARRGWMVQALACLCWTVGMTLWTTPSAEPGAYVPSVADLGFVGFLVGTLAAFLWLAPPSAGTPAARLVDALIAGCGTGLVGWQVVQATHGAQRPLLTLALTLTYLASDVALLTLAAVTIVRTRAAVRSWLLLGAAVVALAVSHIAIGHQLTVGGYERGGPADWGLGAGFCLLAVAARIWRPGPARVPRPRADGGGVLAYGMLGAGALASIVLFEGGERPDAVSAAVATLLVALVLVRQYVALVGNRALARTLRARDAQLHRLAHLDALTGLANRSGFLDALGAALAGATGRDRPVSVVIADLDGFKAVNDSIGHALGDALLVGVAERLLAVVPDADALARVGGDEFAVLVDGEGADDVAEAVRRVLAAPFPLDRRTVVLSAGIGVATAEPGRPPETAGALLHRADIAMYAGKATGPGGLRREPPQPGPAPVDPRPTTGVPQPRVPRADPAGALADAIDRRALQAFYQPVVDTGTGRIVALEALARWPRDGREIGPDAFVPLAERTGLSGPLTQLMVDLACAQLGRWSRQLGHQRLRVAVNVSPADLADRELPGRVRRILDRNGLAREQLALEVTETPMWRPDEVLDVLHALRATGVRIAIDDFGTGYSSLSRLADMPLDTLKIDRTFVADIDHDLRRRHYLAGLLDLGRHLGLRTIAEGVERPGQLAVLRELRCDLVQGHLTGHPSPAAMLTPLVLADAAMVPPERRTVAPAPRTSTLSSMPIT